MTNEELIQGARKIYNKREPEYEVDLFLHQENVPMEKFDEIKTAAKALSDEDLLKSEPKKFKIKFALFVVLTLVSFYFFFSWLPNLKYFRHPFMLSVVGGFVTSVFLFLVWVYYKTWTEKSIREGFRFRFNGVFFVVALFPTFILSAINWWIYTSAGDRLLAKNHEFAIGTVIDGSSYSTRRADFTSIDIRFKTKDGKMHTASYSISKQSFDQYYQGRQVELIYYPPDPALIQLVYGESSYQKYFGSEEREMNMSDLLKFASMNHDSLAPELNKISYQWIYQSADSAYINEKRQSAYKWSDNGIVFVDQLGMNRYPGQLEKLGFEMILSDSAKGIIPTMYLYESDKFIVSLELKSFNYGPQCITSIVPRQEQ